MNDSIKILQRRKKKIFENWINIQRNDDGLRDDLISNDDQRAQSEELLNAIIDSLNEKTIKDFQSTDFDGAKDILSGISVARAKRGFSSKETGTYIFGLKEAMFQTLAEENTNASTLFADSLVIGKLMDNFGSTAFETFLKGREEVILRQTDEIAEISTPVIQVWDGILALPIIGTLDSSRTQVVMENLLQQIVESGSTIAILDISGVPAVDSLVAQHLIKTVSATRLMGAECIISGIRPEIAQTVVHLGIDLSQIITKASMASALKTAFAILQLEVSKKQQRNNQGLK